MAKRKAIGLDMGPAFEKATNEKAPHVRQCVGPFYFINIANEAIDKACRWSGDELRRLVHTSSFSRSTTERRTPTTRDNPLWVEHTHWDPSKDLNNLSGEKLEVGKI